MFLEREGVNGIFLLDGAERLGERMQTFRILVFIGLSFAPLNVNVFGNIIWEDVRPHVAISFSKFSTVTISVSLPEVQKASFLSFFKREVGDRAEIIYVKDLSKNFATIMSSQLGMHFALSTTENPSINILQVYSTAYAELRVNQEQFNAVVWEKNYLLQSSDEFSKDLEDSLKDGLKLLLSKYFSSQNLSGKKPTFYFFFNP